MGNYFVARLFEKVEAARLGHDPVLLGPEVWLCCSEPSVCLMLKPRAEPGYTLSLSWLYSPALKTFSEWNPIISTLACTWNLLIARTVFDNAMDIYAK